jgi:glycosyltransferase involved in cell wall biosynthesis
MPLHSTDRTRVLLVIKNLQQGGSEGQVLLIRQLVDPERFDLRLCIVRDEIHYDALPAGIPEYRLKQPSFGPSARQALLDVIESFKPHVVHSFRDQVNFHLRWALRACSYYPALLTSVRGRPIYPNHLVAEHWLHRRSYRIATNSRGVAAVLRRYARVPADKMAVIPNLIDTSRFGPTAPEDRLAARRQIALPLATRIFLLPARISFVKNHLALISALGLLKARDRIPANVRFLLVGRVRDWSVGWCLPRLIEGLGLTDQVLTFGPQQDIKPFYQAADWVILPSVVEGMPNAVLEAHLSGLPVLVSATANTDQIVRDGLTGVVLPRPDPLAIARGLDTAIACDADRCGAMGQEGRRWVLAQFDQKRTLARLEALYLDAVREQYREGAR